MLDNIIFCNRFRRGGTITFTAHLLYFLKLQKIIRPFSKKPENKIRNFGYGLYYQNMPAEIIGHIPSICTCMSPFDNDTILPHIKKDKIKFTVIHDPLEITDKLLQLMRKDYLGQIITIRQATHDYLLNNGVESMVLPHPFYPFPKVTAKAKSGAVSISRIAPNKNIKILLEANKHLKEPIKIYGSISNSIYAYRLGSEFKKYYHGEFALNFQALSNILSPAKYVIDLTTIKHDGGGTQYTFLEGIYHGCVLVLNKKWTEIKGSIFKNNYNCITVEDEKELAYVLTNTSDHDLDRINQNAQLLLKNHIEADWTIIANQNNVKGQQ